MTFNWIQYKELNIDLLNLGIKTEEQIVLHYNLYGKNENRMTTIYQLYPDFDWAQYRDNYPKLGYHYKAKELYENHWLQFGRHINYTFEKITHPLQTITFITPTIGRTSLINTIKSVINQTCSNWKYIIVFDGIKIAAKFNELIKTDSRISSIIIEKTGRKNYGGKVRNRGIEKVDTEWIGFVDDDDIISPKYVEYMNEYIDKYPTVKCIIYRMLSNNITRGIKNQVLPSPATTNFNCCDVGISFCYKLELFKEGLIFEPSHTEDFILLDKIRNSKYFIILSNYIGYYVSYIDKSIDLLSIEQENIFSCIY